MKLTTFAWAFSNGLKGTKSKPPIFPSRHQCFTHTINSIYYQHAPERLSVCPITVHALLHIADSIEDMGPVWTYWAFPTERYCGKLQRMIKSRRHPFANLDNSILAHARLSQIKILYGLEAALALAPSKGIATRGFSSPECKYF